MTSFPGMPLHRQLQLHPNLYCLMATDAQAAAMLHIVAAAIEYEGLSGQTAEWLRQQARRAFGVNSSHCGDVFDIDDHTNEKEDACFER